MKNIDINNIITAAVETINEDIITLETFCNTDIFLKKYLNYYSNSKQETKYYAQLYQSNKQTIINEVIKFFNNATL